MRGSAFIAFFGIATAISGSLIGCGDEDETEQAKPVAVTKSGEGQSCVRTDDCEEGLACFSNVCLDEPGSTGGTSGTGGSGTGGVNPTLGGEGETCSRRADCQTGLNCFNQRCTRGTGEGGAGPAPTVGGPGETCAVSSDCDAGLVCMPGGQGVPGVGFVGVCTPQDTDVAPTGKTCNGAECERALDCCELPVELQVMLMVRSCADLEDVLAGVTCDATATVLQQSQCFANDAYCAGCTANTWECTETGRCLYVEMCSDDGLVPGGCPTFSRAGNALISTCDAATDLCQAPGTAPPCEDDVDCEGFAVSDDAADTCNGDECICFESRCLRRCDSDLDCPVSTPMAPAAQRYECDEPAEVCIPEDSCLSHETCKVRLADYRAECSPQGTCTVPCVTDLDCNRGGLTGGLVAVCDDADGLCKPIGCTDHLECVGTANGVRLFCTAPVAPGAGDAVSAITD